MFLKHNSLLQNNRAFDIEKQVENIVYNELIHQGYNVTVGQLAGKEIDFIAQKTGGEPGYIQVAYLLASEETKAREFGNLALIKNNYPKYVISLDPFNDKSDYNGIKHLSLQHFLTFGL